MVDWARLFKELGLTQEIVASIQAAILKVGSKDKLKPIKEELPEEVNFKIVEPGFIEFSYQITSTLLLYRQSRLGSLIC